MKKSIACWVILVHMGLVCWMVVQHAFSPSQPLTGRIAVHTASTPVAIQTQNQVQHSKPQAVSSPQKKKSVQPKKVQRQKGDTSKPSPSRTVQSRAPFEVTIPVLPEGPIASSSAETKSYGDLLVELFQTTLQLPEFGEVQARLAIGMDGTIEHIEILDTKNSKNAEWIQQQLALIHLPAPREFGLKDSIQLIVFFRNQDYQPQF